MSVLPQTKAFHHVSLSSAQLDVVFQALAGWSGQQAGGLNFDGANDTIAVYNELAGRTGRRGPLRPVDERYVAAVGALPLSADPATREEQVDALARQELPRRAR